MQRTLLAVVVSVVLALPAGAQAPGKNAPLPPALATLGGATPEANVVWDGQAGAPVSPVPVANPVPVAGCSSCDGCSSCCTPCGPQGRFWVTGEFLLWWMKGDQLPPLVTTSTTPEAAGIPGTPGTAVLFGGAPNNDGARYGFRAGVGLWLDDCHRWGVEAAFFVLNQANDGFLADGRGGAILARPFFDVDNLQPDALLVSLPGVLAGAVAMSSSSEFYGADLNLRRQLSCRGDACCGHRIDLIAGFRYLQLEETLGISTNIETLDPNLNVPVGTRFILDDAFRTQNEFLGGQIGAAAEWWRDRWFINVRGLIGLGVNRQEVEIAGSTAILIPGLPADVRSGGLLAQPTNIGTFSRSEFAIVPEIGLTVGCQLTENLRVFAGYNLIWWTNVVRPGDVIDLGVNPTQIAGGLVGDARPAFTWRTSDLWIQGINFGVQARF